MGLLERALQYKQKINDSGKYTLIDKIKGPAETEKNLTVEKIEISEFDQSGDIISNLHIVDIENSSTKEKIILQKEFVKNPEEDILLLDENQFSLVVDKENTINETPPVNAIDATVDVNHVDAENIIEEDVVSFEIPDDKNNLEPQNNNKDEVAEIKVFEMPEFNDFGTLYEIQKEFIKADTIEDVYSTILFSIMGQLGVSSVSIVAPSVEDENKWIISDAHGIKISDNDLNWNINDGILQILNTYKGVLDIEDIKNDSNLRDDYYKFTSVDARILTPLLKNDKLAGAILVGEKINSVDFTEIEIEFLQALSEIASSIIESLYKYEKLNTELFALRIEKEILSDVELFQDSILNVSSISNLSEVIKKNFYSLGLESYAIFIKDHLDGDYYPAYYESDDILGFTDSGFKIKKDNRLITFLINKKSSIILENFNESSVIIDTYGRNRIVKMELFIAYPFLISGKLSGFITIFKINPAVDIIDIDIRIQKVNRFLLPYIYRIYDTDPELNKFNELTAHFYERIENEIQHSRDLNIPLSLIMFSIKNYKRFYERFGRIEFDKLFLNIADIIKLRLNPGDFSARIDRSKFLVVLPGKEKRYSVMIANTIKNEIIEKYNSSDFKLLITSLNSVYPEDGSDLFTILELLE